MMTWYSEISVFYDGEALLVDAGKKDILFPDIEMNGMDFYFLSANIL